MAHWCAQPIEVCYPGCVVTPLVLGPNRVPVVTDLVVASHNPELTVLSALTHGAEPGRKAIFQALLAALQKVDEDHVRLYIDLVFAGLPEEAQRDLEEQLMATIANPEYRSDFLRNFAAKRRDEGRAEGEAKAVLMFLAARDIDVPEDARVRIAGCTDLDQLETWVHRAATATSVKDMFGS